MLEEQSCSCPLRMRGHQGTEQLPPGLWCTAVVCKVMEALNAHA